MSDEPYSRTVDIRNPNNNTKLGPLHELMFRQWMDTFDSVGDRKDLNHDPDDPGHMYDYRGQYKAGVPYQYDPSDSMLHGDSRFKKPGHTREIIEDSDGQYLDTTTGQKGWFMELLDQAHSRSRPR